MQNINAFFAAHRGQGVYYPAEFEASELNDNGTFKQSHSWKIEHGLRNEFEKAVIADGLHPFRFNGYFI